MSVTFKVNLSTGVKSWNEQFYLTKGISQIQDSSTGLQNILNQFGQNLASIVKPESGDSGQYLKGTITESIDIYGSD